MSKKKSFLAICMLSFSLVFISCKNTKKEDSNKANTEQNIDEEQTTDKAEKATTSEDEITTNLITENEEEYPRDIAIFEDEDFLKRFKTLVGDAYDSIQANFDTETPIVSDKGVYKFSGCKEHDCPSFHTTVLYDAHEDNLNVLVEKNGQTKVYDENGKIQISEALNVK